MTVIYLMLPVSLLLALIFLIAYIWSVRSGQYEDTSTPALRLLADDASTESLAVKSAPSSKRNA